MSRNRQILAWAILLSLGPITAWTAIRRGRSDVVPTDGFAEAGRGDADVATPPSEPLDRAEEVVTARESAANVSIFEPAVPRLITGIVVDEGDLPVPEADVTVYEIGQSDRYRHSSRIVARTESDAEGRFQVSGVHASLHLEVRGSKPGFTRSSRVDFMRGAADVKVVLRRGGVVAGRILVDPGIALDKFRVRIEGAGNEPIVLARPGEPEDAPTIPDSSGNFVFEEVPYRTVDLLVEQADHALTRVPGVRVRGAGESPDPRLDPLDLRGLFETLSIAVLDDGGRPCEDARVVVRPGLDEKESRSKLTRGGRVEFLIRTGPHDVEVELPGWRRANLSGVVGDQVVRLRRGIPVRVAVRGGLPSTDPPAQLFVGLIPADRRGASADDVCVLDEAHEARLIVSSAGQQEIAWYLERGNVRRYFSDTPRRTVRIADREAEQIVTLDLPPEVREAWIRAGVEKGLREEESREEMRVK